MSKTKTIELSTKLKDFNGKEIGGTVGNVIRNLMSAYEDKDKMKAYRIGLDCAADTGEVELTKEEVKLILEQADKKANALVYGQLSDLLDIEDS